jgi:hypothetical protein
MVLPVRVLTKICIVQAFSTPEIVGIHVSTGKGTDLSLHAAPLFGRSEHAAAASGGLELEARPDLYATTALQKLFNGHGLGEIVSAGPRLIHPTGCRKHTAVQVVFTRPDTPDTPTTDFFLRHLAF